MYKLYIYMLYRIMLKYVANEHKNSAENLSNQK